jgi:hypothetical protein
MRLLVYEALSGWLLVYEALISRPSWISSGCALEFKNLYAAVFFLGSRPGAHCNSCTSCWHALLAADMLY